MRTKINKENYCGSGREKTDCITAVLHRSLSCRLGLTNGKEPYVIPMIFTFIEKDGNFDIYLHVHHLRNDDKPSRKREYIDYHKDNKIDVCIEWDVVGSFIPSMGEKVGIGCFWTVAHSSVIGYGEICEVVDDNEKRQALEQQLTRYTSRKWKIRDKEYKDVDVLKISLKDEKTNAKFKQIEFPQSFSE